MLVYEGCVQATNVKRPSRVTLVPQHGKVVERFVIIRMKMLLTKYVGMCTWMI